MKNIVLLSLLIAGLFLISCNKTDWRDSHIGSYNVAHFYEYPSLNLSTGQVYGYVMDVDSIYTPKNVQIIKNDYADKYTVKVDGRYLMDVDKDNYCTLPNAHFTFKKDTLNMSLDNYSDTTRWGRYTFVGLKN
jgi:hypothetical protein